MIHQVISDVTARIRERSVARRQAFLPASSVRQSRARPAPPWPVAT